MWELACLRRRWVSHYLQRLAHRFRGQARSHSFDRCLGLGLTVLHRHFHRRHKPVPTLEYIPNVGAGLLAKAVDQLAYSSTDTPLSRASPLPQF
ncbi:hypothetical protein C9382_24395 [Pseudomonas aylmerensis]|uniref:Uncharacterized protein n=1 Tax=Pseudomonas aylmerensis TaxID=1869229 RepID=A0A2T4FQ21_9PSED|nr:hypothetical protein C9382_24395 [Pseudomonas aylmerensis]